LNRKQNFWGRGSGPGRIHPVFRCAYPPNKNENGAYVFAGSDTQHGQEGKKQVHGANGKRKTKRKKKKRNEMPTQKENIEKKDTPLRKYT
jgi:hypothetical protein